MNAAASSTADKAVELIKPVLGELVTPFIRAVCMALTAGYVLLGWQLVTDPTAEAFDRPIFDGVFAVANPRAWGLAFLTCAILLLLTAITGRAGIYLLAIVAATVTLAAWASTIVYTAVTNPDAVLTLSAVGLYVLDFVALIGLAMSPRQLATADRPVLADLGDGSGTVVELRQRDDQAV